MHFRQLCDGKRFYIKTEPGGKISFGRMSDNDLDLFNKSRSNGSLSKDILYKVQRGLPPYRLAQGVINSGADGDLGNEGIIEIVQGAFAPLRDSFGNYVPGTYVVYLALSKVSIEFKISNKSIDEYDPRKLVEESLVIDLPDCVNHGTYGDLKFNLVTGYRYDGKIVRNANKTMVDRGYDVSISIFSVCGDKFTLLYEMVDGKENFF